MNCPACQTPYNPGNRFCGRCGAELPAASADPPAASPPPSSFPPYAPSPEFGPAADRPAAFDLGEPAGFWRRVPAYLVDALVVTLPLLLLWTLLGQPLPTAMSEILDPPPGYQRLQLLNAFLSLVYDTALIALYAATWGKRLFGMYVVRTDGTRVGWGRALARHLLTALTAAFTLGFAFLIVAIRPDKRGLHDLICDTVVLRRDRRDG